MLAKPIKTPNFHYPMIQVLEKGQSHDFWGAYSLFVARVASFASERSEGANDATRAISFPELRSP